MELHQQTLPRRWSRTGIAGLTLAVLLAGSFSATASFAADEELVVNGGFESGTSGWIVNNGNPADGANLGLTDAAFSGASAGSVTGRLTTGSGPMQELTGKLQANKSYTLSARIKFDGVDAPATKQFFATMHYGGSTYTNLLSVTATKGQWAHISGTFTIPSTQSVGTTRLFFETPWASADTVAGAPATHLMDFVLDDVSVVGAAPPPPASKTIEVVGKTPGEHNPLLSHKFGADGFGFVDKGRVYMYMTNDTQGYAPNPSTGISPQINYGSINQITVISSDDMVNWTDHGEIQVAGPNGVAPFTNNSWAPGMAKKVVNGVEKYFLYYANGGGSSNVLTGSSPIGPWTSERTSTLINSSTPGAQGVSWLFDPAPLVDDDGEAYLYFGGGPAATIMPAAERFNNPKNIRAIKLGDDMVSTSGEAVVVDAPVAFEAAQVFKREGKYYLSYSSHFGGNDFGGSQTTLPGYPGGGQIGYMMSDDPMVWDKSTYAGVLFPNQGAFFGSGTGGNNHQSVFEFNGKFYFTYHAPTLNKKINGDSTQGYRSAHIQELAFNEDGTIKQVVGDYAGPAQVANLDPYGLFEAETIAWQQGLTTKKVDGSSPQFGANTPNLVLDDVDNGDWTALSAVDFGTDGAASVSAKVKSLVAGAQIQVRLDERTNPVVGTLNVDSAIGEWAELSATLDGVTGVHDVYFTFTGPTGANLVEVDTWSFTAADGSAPSLDVTTSASTRCIAGKVILTVQAKNNNAVPVDVTIASSHGSKAFTAIAPGKSASNAVTIRQASVPAGEATVSVAATIDGAPVTSVVTTPYDARSCN
jgi:arabinoxylan arabinofuranohydrolase